MDLDAPMVGYQASFTLQAVDGSDVFYALMRTARGSRGSAPSDSQDRASADQHVRLMVFKHRAAMLRSMWQRAKQHYPPLRGRFGKSILHIKGPGNPSGEHDWSPRGMFVMVAIGSVGDPYEPWDSIATLVHELAHAAAPLCEGHGRRWRREVRRLAAWFGMPPTPELLAARSTRDLDSALYEMVLRHMPFGPVTS